jgi:hypothetical protein
MNKTYFLSMLASFIMVLMLALPVSSYAVTGAYNYVNETSTTYTSRSGPYTNVTTTGYPSTNKHAYKSTQRDFGGPNNTMRWKCKTSYTTEYNFHIYIAIPENYDVLDGVYAYDAYNTNPSENFDPPVNVNQENYVDQWVYIGWTRGKGGSTNCYVYTDNIELYGGGSTREFWVDHMKYWPNSSTTPPAYTHEW